MKLTTMAALAGVGAAAAVGDPMMQAPILRDSGGGYEGGQILFANDSRINESFYSEPLTGYLSGWKETMDIEKTLNFLAPQVQVGRRFNYKKFLNAEAFLSEVDDLRAIGSDFKRVDYKAVDASGTTLNKGLTYIQDLDNVVGNWQQTKTAKLMERILRNDLRRAKSLLSAASTNTAKTWDTSAGKDPDQDVENELSSGADDAGMVPNRVIYGHTAWLKRRLAHRAQTTAGGFGSSKLTEEELASYLGVDGVKVSRERYQNAAATKAQIVSNLVIAFFGQDGADENDPTSMKRFVTPFSAEQGGGMARVYVQNLSAKLVALTVEIYSDIVVTATPGIRQLTIS